MGTLPPTSDFGGIEHGREAEKMGSVSKIASLNCVSLSNPNVQKSVFLLKQACLDSGFFYLIDHGIPSDLTDAVFFQSKKFFGLPIDEKMKLVRKEKNRGYTPFLDEVLDIKNQVNGDHKEGYYIRFEVNEDDPQSEKPFFMPNVWPSEDILPKWRQTMEQYQLEAMEVARKVARLIALALDLDVGFFDTPKMLGGQTTASLRLLHYEGKVSEPANGIFAAGAHSDYGLLTLLATDDVLGLQICKEKDAHPRVWEYVTPLKGSLIVNIGDMLERWSNCIFRSTLHRVVLDGQERYSFALFVNPSYDCLIECLPPFVSEKTPPKFPPVTWGAYLRQKYRDTHVDPSSSSK